MLSGKLSCAGFLWAYDWLQNSLQSKLEHTDSMFWKEKKSLQIKKKYHSQTITDELCSDGPSSPRVSERFGNSLLVLGAWKDGFALATERLRGRIQGLIPPLHDGRWLRTGQLRHLRLLLTHAPLYHLAFVGSLQHSLRRRKAGPV